MVRSPGWGAAALAAGRLPAVVELVALSVALVGCRTNPTNPFAQQTAPTAEDALAAEGPLADSLARLKQSGKNLRDSASQTADAARGLGTDAQAVAQDAAAGARQTVTDTLNEAEAQGRELAASTSAQLQADAIASLEELPLEQAGPILLVAMSQGGPATRKAASEQLARRWPPAAGYAIDAAAEQRQRAIAQLRSRWIEQYGQLDEAVAAAQAQAAHLVDSAGQVVDQAATTVQNTQRRIDDMRQMVAALREADLPASARQELSTALNQASQNADAAVRARAAKAMGEVGDPMFVPALLVMLADQPEVKGVAQASLTQVAGEDVTAGRPEITDEERVALWEQWYRAKGATQTR